MLENITALLFLLAPIALVLWFVLNLIGISI